MSISYSVSPIDIIKAYNKYQENMLVIDVVKFRESGNKQVNHWQRWREQQKLIKDKLAAKNLE